MSRARTAPSPPSVVDRAIADFVEGPVSIAIGSRRDDLVPELVRALGARVLPDGRVVVIVARSQSEAVLECVEAGHPIAVVFSRPTSERTVQLKAPSANVAKAGRADLEAVARYRRALSDELEQIGFGGAFAAALLDGADDDLVAVCFTPHEAFDQTPGPEAGRVIACPAATPDRRRKRS